MAEHFGRKLHCVRTNTISSSTPENKAPPCTTYIPVISSKASPSSVTLSEPFRCLYLKSAAFVFSWQTEAPRVSCICPNSWDQLRAPKIAKVSIFNVHPWSEQTMAVLQGATQLQLLVPEQLFHPDLYFQLEPFYTCGEHELRWLVQVWQEAAAASEGLPLENGPWATTYPISSLQMGLRGFVQAPSARNVPREPSWAEGVHEHLLEQHR